MKAKEKRKARSYKIADKVYNKALRRGRKEGIPLASFIEQIVAEYADGWTIAKYDTIPDLASKIIVPDWVKEHNKNV